MPDRTITRYHDVIDRSPDDESPEIQKKLKELDDLIGQGGFKEPSRLIKHPWFRTQPELQNRLKDIVNVSWYVEQKRKEPTADHPMDNQIRLQLSNFMADCLVSYGNEYGIELKRINPQALRDRGWSQQQLKHFNESIPPHIFSKLSNVLMISEEIGIDVDKEFSYALLHEPKRSSRRPDPILYLDNKWSGFIEVGRWR